MSKPDLERLDDLGTEAWSNHQPETFAGLFADEFVARDLMVPEPDWHKGGSRGVYAVLVDRVPRFACAIDEPRDRRTRGRLGSRVHGTNTGPMRMAGVEIPPTNKSVVGPIAYFIKVKGGRVVEYSYYYPDTVGTMIQLGLMPQP